MENERTRLTKEILYNSLAQAIIRLAQTPFKLVKIFLALSVVLSSGLAIIYIYGSFEAFFMYEVTTTSRQILETPTLFPKITICNRNRFQTRKALDFLVEINKIINANVNFFDVKQIASYNYSFKYDLAILRF